MIIQDPILTNYQHDNEINILKFLSRHEDRLDGVFEDGLKVLHRAADEGHSLVIYYIMSKRFDATYWYGQLEKYSIDECAYVNQRVDALLVIQYFHNLYLNSSAGRRDTDDCFKTRYSLMRESQVYFASQLSDPHAREKFLRISSKDQELEGFIFKIASSVQCHLMAQSSSIRLVRYLGWFAKPKNLFSSDNNVLLNEKLLSEKKND